MLGDHRAMEKKNKNKKNKKKKKQQKNKKKTMCIRITALERLKPWNGLTHRFKDKKKSIEKLTRWSIWRQGGQFDCKEQMNSRIADLVK